MLMGVWTYERLVVHTRDVGALCYPTIDSSTSSLFDIYGPPWIREDASWCLTDRTGYDA